MTFQKPTSVADTVDLLEKRLRENSWIVTFKVLIVLHSLMRQDNGDRVILYVDSKPSTIDTSRSRGKSVDSPHSKNIALYTTYLQHKVLAHRQLNMDYVKMTLSTKVGRLRHLSVSQGLLSETAAIQKQIGALLECNFTFDNANNSIVLHAFRLLVLDLLALFKAINEGVVNILEHYFTMNKLDAKQSLDIYKRFAKQTEQTVTFLQRAKSMERELQINIPMTKHAPLSLVPALEEYLDSADMPSKRPERWRRKVVSSSDSALATFRRPSAKEPFSQQELTQEQKPQPPKDWLDLINIEQTASLEHVTMTPQRQARASYNPFLTQTAMSPTGNGGSFSASLPDPTFQFTNAHTSNAIPSQSSSMVTNSHNPFRSSTILATPQQSLSAPTYTLLTPNTMVQQGLQTNMTSMSPLSTSFYSTQQQQQHQPQHLSGSSNPFASSVSPLSAFHDSQPVASTNPFFAQQQQPPSAWGLTSMF